MGGACAVFDDIRIGSFRDDLMSELGVAARDLRHFVRYIITTPRQLSEIQIGKECEKRPGNKMIMKRNDHQETETPGQKSELGFISAWLVLWQSASASPSLPPALREASLRSSKSSSARRFPSAATGN